MNFVGNASRPTWYSERRAGPAYAPRHAGCSTARLALKSGSAIRQLWLSIPFLHWPAQVLPSTAVNGQAVDHDAAGVPRRCRNRHAFKRFVVGPSEAHVKCVLAYGPDCVHDLAEEH